MAVTTVTETADGQTTTETHMVDLTYDASGNPQTITYDGTTYYYTVNIQGDVTGIVDESGTLLVEYFYLGYGTTCYYKVPAGSLSETLVKINPLIYRGYVYDKETKLYYLQSRYYNRTSGRFINADAYASTGQGLLGNNMFAYCLNNPILFADPSGTCAIFWGFKLCDCGKVSCPDSEKYDPDAPVVVVFYDSRSSGFFGIGGDGGFEHQGKELIDRLSEEYNVVACPYVTMDDFISSWNSLDGEYAEIYIVGHGQAGKFNAVGGSLTADNFGMLEPVNVTEIFLYICNGATYDGFNNSTANNFSRLTGATVWGVRNGKLNFSWYGCYPELDTEHHGYWFAVW